MTMSVWTGAPGGSILLCGKGDGRADADADGGRDASW